MNESAFGPRSRRLLGLILLVVSTGLAFGAWYSANRPLKELAWIEDHRSPADSLAYGSAVYHATHARATHANRWRLNGYATLGALGTLLGIGLLVSSRSRRTV